MSTQGFIPATRYVVFYPFYLFIFLYFFIFLFSQGTAASNKFLFVQVAGFDKAARENMASPSILFRWFSCVLFFFLLATLKCERGKETREKERN